jgi:hypothetical protein
MNEGTDKDIKEHAGSEIGKEVQGGCQGGGLLNLLEVEGREKLDAVHDAIGEGDHDAGRCERYVFPETVGDEGGLGSAFATAHPCWKSQEKDNADGEKSRGFR